MESIFYQITGSIGDSLEQINTNYLNLDLLIGDENKTDSFVYKTKNIETLINAYDKYKDIFTTLLDNWNKVDSFCTMVEENSAKWLVPYTFFYPYPENFKFFLSSTTNQNQIITKVINWLNVAYPLLINVETCDSSAEYVEGQTAFVQFFLNEDHTTIDVPSPDVTSDSGYCTTMRYDTCINCQRIYHGYTFCGTGQVFNCEGATVDFTTCGTVECTFTGPYEKIKIVDKSENQEDTQAIEQVKSTITSTIEATYENKKEYTFIQTIKAKVVGCQWVFDSLLPHVTFKNISEDFHWCEIHQTFDDCPLTQDMLDNGILQQDQYCGNYCEENQLDILKVTGLTNSGLPAKQILPKFISDIVKSTKSDGTTIINL